MSFKEKQSVTLSSTQRMLTELVGDINNQVNSVSTHEHPVMPLAYDEQRSELGLGQQPAKKLELDQEMRDYLLNQFGKGKKHEVTPQS